MNVVDENKEVGRLLGHVAAELDRLGYAKSGVVRRGARLLLGLDVPPPAQGPIAGDDVDACRCGAELVQPATGRRRKWCSEKCREAHR